MKKLFSYIVITFMLLMSFTNISMANSYVMHTVNNGDTLWKLSKTYQKDVSSIISINNRADESLDTGDFIKIKPLYKNIDIYVNQVKLNPDSSPYLDNNRTFVPIRFIGEALNAQIQWNGSSSSAIITDGNKTITLPINSRTIYVNGMSYMVEAPIKLYNDRVYVPIRFISEVLGYQVDWDQKNLTAHIKVNKNNSNNNSLYSEEDLYWLSRIVSSEAAAEPYEGKLAVANVIINRKKNNEYPNTIKGVIFDKEHGYQFTPVMNGTIYNNPTADSIKAAKEALEGKNNIGNAMFFVNPKKSNLTWIQSNRTYYTTIQNHVFYL